METETDDLLKNWDDIAVSFVKEKPRKGRALVKKKNFTENKTEATHDECDMCHITYPITNIYRRDVTNQVHHLRTHVDKDDPLMQACPFCYSKFFDNKFSNHLTSEHPGTRTAKFNLKENPIFFTNALVLPGVLSKMEMKSTSFRSPTIHEKSLFAATTIAKRKMFLSIVADRIKNNPHDHWLLFRYHTFKRERTKLKEAYSSSMYTWACSICDDSRYGWTNCSSMRFFILRHLSQHSGDVPGLEQTVQNEWSLLDEDLGESTDLYRSIPKRLIDVQPLRSALFYTIRGSLVNALLSHNADELGTVNRDAYYICTICCEPVRELQDHFQSHQKSFPTIGTYSEFIERSDGDIHELPFPHSILTYSKIVKMGQGDFEDSVPFYRWSCNIPSCPCGSLGSQSDFPLLHLMRAYALRHFETFHPGLFGEKWYQYEWQLVQFDSKLNVSLLDLRLLKEHVNDVGNPNCFVTSWSYLLLPLKYRGLFICSQCYFCALHDGFIDHITEIHGYVHDQEVLYAPRLVERSYGDRAFRTKIHRREFIQILDPPRHLRGDKQVFNNVKKKWLAVFGGPLVIPNDLIANSINEKEKDEEPPQQKNECEFTKSVHETGENTVINDEPVQSSEKIRDFTTTMTKGLDNHALIDVDYLSSVMAEDPLIPSVSPSHLVFDSSMILDFEMKEESGIDQANASHSENEDGLQCLAQINEMFTCSNDKGSRKPLASKPTSTERCKDCDIEIAADRRSTLQHSQMHAISAYRCSLCSFSCRLHITISKHSLVTHRKVGKGVDVGFSSEMIYIIWRRCFPETSRRFDEIVPMETFISSLNCEECHKFVAESGIRSHLLSHMKEPQVKCSICSAGLLKTSFSRHNKALHEMKAVLIALGKEEELLLSRDAAKRCFPSIVDEWFADWKKKCKLCGASISAFHRHAREVHKSDKLSTLEVANMCFPDVPDDELRWNASDKDKKKSCGNYLSQLNISNMDAPLLLTVDVSTNSEIMSLANILSVERLPVSDVSDNPRISRNNVETLSLDSIDLRMHDSIDISLATSPSHRNGEALLEDAPSKITNYTVSHLTPTADQVDKSSKLSGSHSEYVDENYIKENSISPEPESGKPVDYSGDSKLRLPMQSDNPLLQSEVSADDHIIRSSRRKSSIPPKRIDISKIPCARRLAKMSDLTTVSPVGSQVAPKIEITTQPTEKSQFKTPQGFMDLDNDMTPHERKQMSHLISEERTKDVGMKAINKNQNGSKKSPVVDALTKIKKIQSKVGACTKTVVTIRNVDASRETKRLRQASIGDFILSNKISTIEKERDSNDSATGVEKNAFEHLQDESQMNDRQREKFNQAVDDTTPSKSKRLSACKALKGIKKNLDRNEASSSSSCESSSSNSRVYAESQDDSDTDHKEETACSSSEYTKKKIAISSTPLSRLMYTMERAATQSPIVNTATSVTSSSSGTAERLISYQRIMQQYSWDGDPPGPLTDEQVRILSGFSKRNACLLCKRQGSLRMAPRASARDREESMLAHFLTKHSDYDAAKMLIDRKRYYMSLMDQSDGIAVPFPFRLQPNEKNTLSCSSCIGDAPKCFDKLSSLKKHWFTCTAVGNIRKETVMRNGIKFERTSSSSRRSTLRNKYKERNGAVRCPLSNCMDGWRPSIHYSDEVSVIAHLFYKHTDDEQAYNLACEMADFISLTTEFPFVDIRESFRLFVVGNPPKMKCALCDGSFDVIYELVRHSNRHASLETKRKHNVTRSFGCPFGCTIRVLDSEKDLKESTKVVIHMLRAHLFEPKIFEYLSKMDFNDVASCVRCPIDLIGSAKKSLLKGTCVLKCAHCEFSSVSPGLLGNHVKLKHGEDRFISYADRLKMGLNSMADTPTTLMESKGRGSWNATHSKCQFCSLKMYDSQKYAPIFTLFAHMLACHSKDSESMDQFEKNCDVSSLSSEFPFVDFVKSVEFTIEQQRVCLTCVLCGVSTATLRELCNHYSRTHSDESLKRSRTSLSDDVDVKMTEETNGSRSLSKKRRKHHPSERLLEQIECRETDDEPETPRKEKGKNDKNQSAEKCSSEKPMNIISAFSTLISSTNANCQKSSGGKPPRNRQKTIDSYLNVFDSTKMVHVASSEVQGASTTSAPGIPNLSSLLKENVGEFKPFGSSHSPHSLLTPLSEAEALSQNIFTKVKEPKDLSKIPGAQGVRCNMCSYMGRSSREVRVHYRVAHPADLLDHGVSPGLARNGLPCTCAVCAAPMSTRKELQSHASTQHSKEDKCFTCQYCISTFHTFLRVREHERRLHETSMLIDPEDLNCPHCTLQFENKRNRDIHVKRHFSINSTVGMI